MAWFHQRTQHRFVLMPHRREPTVANAPQHLYVDGPIKSAGQVGAVWASDEEVVATGRFRSGPEIGFVKASNPHSGSFCVSAQQLEHLRMADWPPATFVSPLETAATGTVLQQFPILKPSWACREFLALEHGNPSFLRLMGEWPVRQPGSPVYGWPAAAISPSIGSHTAVVGDQRGYSSDACQVVWFRLGWLRLALLGLAFTCERFSGGVCREAAAAGGSGHLGDVPIAVPSPSRPHRNTATTSRRLPMFPLGAGMQQPLRTGSKSRSGGSKSRRLCCQSLMSHASSRRLVMKRGRFPARQLLLLSRIATESCLLSRWSGSTEHSGRWRRNS